MNEMQVFSSRLKSARLNAKMTQDELGKKIGGGQSKISPYEHENGPEPSIIAASKLAKALGVSLDWLGGISDDPYPIQKVDGHEFLKYLLNLLLIGKAEWVDKTENQLSGSGFYIHFCGCELNGLDNKDIPNLLKLLEVAEDDKEAISKRVSRISDEYGDKFNTSSV